MSDIQTVWNIEAGRGDYQIDGATLLSGLDLNTAVLISLFSDRLANADDVIPDLSGDPRGWPCDSGTVILGSRLWLLDRSKQTQAVLNAAKDYVHEALQWMIDDGVVARFDVTVEWTRPGMLGVKVVAFQQDGTQQPALLYSYVWRQF